MLKLGQILSLNETNNTAKVKDIYDNSIIDIEIGNIIQLQIMPIVNDIVLYLNLQDKIFKIIKIWAVEPNALIRGGDFPLREGETQIMGILGQYVYLDREGTIKFVDASLLNLVELNEKGIEMQVKNMKFTTYNGIDVEIGENIIISRDKNNKTLTEQKAAEMNEGDEEETTKEFELKIDDNGMSIIRKEVEIIIDTNNKISIKANEAVMEIKDNVSINGAKVCLGGLATDPTLGDVVTGGPLGSMPFCFVTGAPIIGSTKVKAAK